MTNHRTKYFLIAVLLVLFVMLFIGILFVSCSITKEPEPLPELPETVWEVQDTVQLPEPEPPLMKLPRFNQEDPRWADHPYGCYTIGTHGCGLCVAAATYSKMEEVEITPLDLEALVGGNMITDGFNDMEAFANLGTNIYRTQHSEKMYLWEDVYQAISEGKYVWVGVSGQIVDQYYDSHVICLYAEGGYDDEGGIIGDDVMGLYDPMYPYIVYITQAEFERCNMLYAIAIWRAEPGLPQREE